MVNLCAECGKQLGNRNRTGYCGRHVIHHNMRQPGYREKLSNGVRRRLMADPELLDSYKARMKAVQASPKAKAARAERWERDKPWLLGNAAQPKGSEPRRRMGRSISEHRMAWCPPELRAAYRQLVDEKRIPTAEARVMILEQHDTDMRRFRQKIGAPA